MNCLYFIPIQLIWLLWLGNSSALMGQSDTPHFKGQVIDANVQIGYGLAIGDVNSDGKIDILLADKTEFVWYDNPNWQRKVMTKDLTEKDNVCLAARDLNGDGVVELAVGAQWNPGETSDKTQSGSVHYLAKPYEEGAYWQPLQLPHYPTVHRMRWIKTGNDNYQLIVLPLHGVGNSRGEGDPVKVLAYSPPASPWEAWSTNIIDESMHLTHNLEVVENPGETIVYIGGKEGIRKISYTNVWTKGKWAVQGHGFGELRIGQLKTGDRTQTFIAGIEPLHGNILSVHKLGLSNPNRRVLTEDLAQGHALACEDLLGLGESQIVVGWRNANPDGKVGIRMYVHQSDDSWKMYTIDDNEMACEDLKVADLDQDGDLDIIAAGRATNNLKVYWNQRF